MGAHRPLAPAAPLATHSKRRQQPALWSCDFPQRPHRILSLLLPLLLLLLLAAQARAAPPDGGVQNVNISIALASPQIIYTPFLCNATQAAANPQLCAGGWQAAATPPSSPTNPPLVSVSLPGPITASSNLIPQLFFQFQASALFFTTTAPSNATAMVTINANGTFLSRQFDSALGAAAVLDIPADTPSLFTITVLPQTGPTLFVLQDITVTAPNNVSLSSLFPSATLPPSASLPTFSTPTVPSTTSSSSTPSLLPTGAALGTNTKKKIAEAVGITVGVGLGLTALAVVGFYFWRKRRRRVAAARGPRRSSTARETGDRERKRRSRRTERRTRNGTGAENGNGNGGERRAADQLDVSQNANSPQSEWSSDSPPRHRPRWPV